MISRTSKSSIVQNFAKSRSMLAGNTAYDPAATWLIQRVAGTGSSATITFSNIPQNYKHLQIRFIGKSTDTAASTSYTYTTQFNGSNTTYAYHYLYGDGTVTGASGSASSTNIRSGRAAIAGSPAGYANIHGVGILDILDYTSTTKAKTLRGFDGVDVNSTGGAVDLYSGLWYATPAAITSISFVLFSGAWTTTSSFALYGITG